jgi:hypothetical protein
MKNLLCFGSLMVALTPALSVAQSPFDGTWKVNMSKSQPSTKTDVYLLQNGIYACKTCDFPFEVKADGKDHPVPPNPYYDTANIEVVDDRTIVETDKKDGKVVINETTTVAPDGKTAVLQFNNGAGTNGSTRSGKLEWTRVAAGPPGSHAVSGSWRTTKVEQVSDNALMFTYKVVGDTLTMTTPTGQSFTAKLDGTEAPFKGDPGTTSVSVRRIDQDSIEETDKRDGKVTFVYRSTVLPDGKTMRFVMENKLAQSTQEFVAEKQ